MHWKDLKAIGEQDQRLYELDAWEESPFYTERERAALAWTEAVTRVAESRVPDELYNECASISAKRNWRISRSRSRPSMRGIAWPSRRERYRELIKPAKVRVKAAGVATRRTSTLRSDLRPKTSAEVSVDASLNWDEN